MRTLTPPVWARAYIRGLSNMSNNPIANLAQTYLNVRSPVAMIQGAISLASGLILLSTVHASTLQAECDHIQGTKLGQNFRPGPYPPSLIAGPDALTDFKFIFTFDGDQPTLLHVAVSIGGSETLMTKTLPVVLRREWIIVANEVVGASDGPDSQNADFWSYALYPELNAGIFIRHVAGDSRKPTRGLNGREIAGEVFQATCRFAHN
jgi:hypothetical protein